VVVVGLSWVELRAAGRTDGEWRTIGSWLFLRGCGVGSCGLELYFLGGPLCRFCCVAAAWDRCGGRPAAVVCGGGVIRVCAFGALRMPVWWGVAVIMVCLARWLALAAGPKKLAGVAAGVVG